MLKTNIPVFLSADNNYAPFVAAAIASICDNTKSFLDFYVLDGGITNENQSKIESLKDRFENFSVSFIKVDTEKYFKNFIANAYVSVATYYRFIIPELFPDIAKGIYLDADVILNGDISDLFNEDLENYAAGAVIDQGNKLYIKKLKTNMDIDLYSNYFNAGVMLINLEKWRKDNISRTLFQIEKQYKNNLLCNDQDVLNKYFENNYKILDKKYNSMFEYKEAAIRHFAFGKKPWHFAPEACIQKYSEFIIFWKYAKLTPFYDEIKTNCKYKTPARAQLLDLMERKADKKENAIEQNPKISVIIPVYNSEPYLRLCLDSICYQTFENIEIICINDCSPDNSLDIIKEYARFDNRIKIIDFKENNGVSNARNEGIKIAKGDYITFVDPDDYLDLDFYEKLYNIALETKADIIKGNMKTKGFNGKTAIDPLNNEIHKQNDNKFYFAHHFTTAIYKTNLIKDNNIIFPENTCNGEDIVFLLQTLLKCKSFKITDDTFYNYIRHENSLNLDLMDNKTVQSFIVSTEKLYNIINKAYLKEISKEDYAIMYSRYLYAILRSFFKCTDNKDKEFCCKKIIELYKTCPESEGVDKYFALVSYFIKLIKKEDSDILFDELIKCKSLNLMPVYSLRKNIKEDMLHA